MALDTDRVNVDENVVEIYVFDDENPEDTRRLVYTINREANEVIMYPGDISVDKIIFSGFNRLPTDLLNEKGYFKAGISYYLNKKLEQKNVERFEVVREGESRIRARQGRHRVVIAYQELLGLKDRIAHIRNESKLDRSQTVDDFFHRCFPRKYEAPGNAERRLSRKLVASLNDEVIEHLSADEIARLFDFMGNVLSNRYTTQGRREELFKAAKIKVDDVAVRDVISKYKRLLEQDPSENDWGRFLERNLFLIDSKYLKVISELNVITAGARRADFGLVDSHGFLDIFEIKKPSTRILARNQDRGNYYWSTDAVKAITQAEKYLYNAEIRARDLGADIFRETNIKVSVIRPRAYLLMGNSDQFENENMGEDFRVLQRSLKSIEVILYDELLTRIKNQMEKVYYQ